MNVLVIGGAGYIGHHVVYKLLSENETVTVYDNLSTGSRNNIFEDVEFIEGDILDNNKLESVFKKGFDALIHLAAFKAAGESMKDPEKYSTNNITGTINIINAAVKYNVKKFVFSSSAAVYGAPKYLPIDEKHPLEPENYYGFTKLEIERILSWYDKIKGLKYAALRYFNAAGYDLSGNCRGLEKNPANLIPVIMETAAGIRESFSVFGNDYETRDGTGLRDYVHVTDLAEAHYSALKYLDEKSESLTVNLGSETGMTVFEIIEKAKEISQKKINYKIAPRRSGDPDTVLASSSLARKKISWNPKNSDAETIISSTWNVYKS